MTERGKITNVHGKRGRTNGRPSGDRTVVNEGLAFLIESEMDRAVIVQAAKAVTTKLQDMAADLSDIESKDLMPMDTQFRAAFGPQMADQFNQIATAKLRELIASVQDSKSTLDNEIIRLETIVNGGDGSDAAMDAAVPAPEPVAPEAPPGDMAAGAAGVGPAGAAPPPPSQPEPQGITGFAGRERKESARPRGKKLTEENVAETDAFKANMDRLATMSAKCFNHARTILDEIHELPVSGAVRNKLVNTLGYVVGLAANSESWHDPESVINAGITAHLSDGPMNEIIDTPEIKDIISQMKRFAHKIATHHDGDLDEEIRSPLAPPPRVTPSALRSGPVEPRILESRRPAYIKRLRESHDPDKVILSAFRRLLSEGHNVRYAVHAAAKMFGIDVPDVVMVIRDAKMIAEDGVPALMGVEMGQPDTEVNPAPMSQIPPQKATVANPQPGKPNQPMSPSDMRMASQARKAADKAAGNMPKQPIAQQPNKVPSREVPRGRGIPGNNMPGKAMNSGNIRTS